MKNVKYDAIVVGGGVAGLSSAAYLAKSGRNVILFEQNNKPGGYYTSFVRQGIIFDISAHWTGFPNKVNEVLKELNVEPVKFTNHEPVGSYLGPDEGSNIILTENKEKFEESILSSYPTVNRKSLNKLIEESLSIYRELENIPSNSLELMSIFSKLKMALKFPIQMRKILKYSNMSTETFLESLFSGNELKGLRVSLHSIAPIKDVGAIGILAFIGFALNRSAYAPVGGAQTIADSFERAVYKNGGTIHYSSEVKSIKIENNAVVGVVLENGMEFDSDVVISAIDAKTTYHKLIDSNLIPEKFDNKLNSTLVSDTYFIVSIVTDIDPSEHGFDGTDVFINLSNEINEALSLNDPMKSSFHLNFPKFRTQDAKQGTYGIQIVFPVTFDFESHWKTGPKLERGEEYIKFKQEFADKLVKRVEEKIPKLGEHILEMDITTPITMYRYTHNYHGAAVGWSYTDLKQWNQRNPFIKGLYQAGHWVGPSGVPSIIFSGKNAAELIIHDQHVNR